MNKFLVALLNRVLNVHFLHLVNENIEFLASVNQILNGFIIDIDIAQYDVYLLG